MTDTVAEPSLEDIRRDIDAIDDAILDLLGKRLAASAQVKQVKSLAGGVPSSPIRPAREAQILRRLLAQRPTEVSPALLVRLWRVILTSSTLAQAPLTLHISTAISHDPDLRSLISAVYCATPLRSHPDASALVSALNERPGDIGLIHVTDVAALLHQSPLRVMGGLAPTMPQGQPQLLAVGRCDPVPSGDDESLLLGPGDVPAMLAGSLIWRSAAAGLTLCAIRGFLTDPPSSDWSVLGAYPRSLEF